MKSFENGDKVKVNLPGAPEHDKIVTIMRPLGPGVIKVGENPFPFKQSYLVSLDGSAAGAFDPMDGAPIIYPINFLSYAEPQLENYINQQRSSWTQFDGMVINLRETISANTIKNGM